MTETLVRTMFPVLIYRLQVYLLAVVVDCVPAESQDCLVALEDLSMHQQNDVPCDFYVRDLEFPAAILPSRPDPRQVRCP